MPFIEHGTAPTALLHRRSTLHRAAEEKLRICVSLRSCPLKETLSQKQYTTRAKVYARRRSSMLHERHCWRIETRQDAAAARSTPEELTFRIYMHRCKSAVTRIECWPKLTFQRSQNTSVHMTPSWHFFCLGRCSTDGRSGYRRRSYCWCPTVVSYCQGHEEVSFCSIGLLFKNRALYRNWYGFAAFSRLTCWHFVFLLPVNYSEYN